MKKLSFLLLFVSFLLCACSHVDISHQSDFRNIVGHYITTKTPQNLYQIDYQLNGYKDRYDLGDDQKGNTLVGVVPPGSSVFIERAVADMGINSVNQYFEGTLEFDGKRYPVAISFLPDGTIGFKFWKWMNANYTIAQP